jgi:hypothetical protein
MKSIWWGFCFIWSWTLISWGFFLIYEQFLDERHGSQVKYRQDDDFILQEAGVICALLVLYIPVFEVNSMINWEIYVWSEDSEETVLSLKLKDHACKLLWLRSLRFNLIHYISLKSFWNNFSIFLEEQLVICPKFFFSYCTMNFSVIQPFCVILV